VYIRSPPKPLVPHDVVILFDRPRLDRDVAGGKFPLKRFWGTRPFPRHSVVGRRKLGVSGPCRAETREREGTVRERQGVGKGEEREERDLYDKSEQLLGCTTINCFRFGGCCGQDVGLVGGDVGSPSWLGGLRSHHCAAITTVVATAPSKMHSINT